jgi:hypothetical protein
MSVMLGKIFDADYADSFIAAAKDIYQNVMKPAFVSQRFTTDNNNYYNNYYTGKAALMTMLPPPLFLYGMQPKTPPMPTTYIRIQNLEMVHLITPIIYTNLKVDLWLAITLYSLHKGVGQRITRISMPTYYSFYPN